MSGDIKVAPSVEPSDPSVATDRIAGRDYQIVKLAFGAEGSVTLVDGEGLPVSVAALPLPAGASTEATLAALKGVTDSLLVAAQAIKAASEAINTKTTEVNTGAIAGTVAVSNQPNPLTDAQLRATPVPVAGSFSATIAPDETAAMMSVLRALVHPIWEEAQSGRLRVVLDPNGGAQTLGTVTTVGTVTAVGTVSNSAQLGAVPANSFIYDQMHAAWANSVRRAVT